MELDDEDMLNFAYTPATRAHRRLYAILEHEWRDPCPMYVAVFEYRTIVEARREDDWPERKLIARWKQPRRFVKRVQAMAREEEEERYGGKSKRYVYFATDGSRIKVGSSYAVRDRLVALSRDVGKPLSLVGSVPGSFHLERKIHARLSDRRIEGEWFAISEEEARTLIAECRSWR